MKKNAQQLLNAEGARFQALAQTAALKALHKSPDGKTINDQDARMIRDHEIRAESFASAATLIA